MAPDHGGVSSGLKRLRVDGTFRVVVGDPGVEVEVDASRGRLTCRGVADRCRPGGRVRRRLAFAVKRALESDVALEWKLRVGDAPVQLDLGGGRGPLLPARMCLPFVADLVKPPYYRYQRSGVARLLRSRRLLLADDMGLGKTIQVAGAMRALIASGRVRHALVVAPATLIDTWVREMAKWTPEMVVTVGGPRKGGRNLEWEELVDQCHVVVTNYEDLRVGMDLDRPWATDLLVADEAHRLKNRMSRTTQAAHLIEAERIWALSGTPMERDSEDLATVLSLLDRHAFTHEDGKLSPDVLRSRAKRLVLRRQKSDVLSDLPKVVCRHEGLAMGACQEVAYRRAQETRPNENSLVRFSRMRTICDVDPESQQSVKAERIVAIVKDIARAGEKAVVFSYRLGPIERLATLLERSNIGCERLVGAMDMMERRRALERFQQGDAVALLASMRVGSEGLTLVEANHVVLVNRWWNPSLNQQAIDRVVRIGQHRPVTVYMFTVVGTVEEDLDRLLERKTGLFDQLVGELTTGGEALDQFLAESGRRRGKRTVYRPGSASLSNPVVYLKASDLDSKETNNPRPWMVAPSDALRA